MLRALEGLIPRQHEEEHLSTNLDTSENMLVCPRPPSREHFPPALLPSKEKGAAKRCPPTRQLSRHFVRGYSQEAAEGSYSSAAACTARRPSWARQLQRRSQSMRLCCSENSLNISGPACPSMPSRPSNRVRFATSQDKRFNTGGAPGARTQDGLQAAMRGKHNVALLRADLKEVTSQQSPTIRHRCSSTSELFEADSAPKVVEVNSDLVEVTPTLVEQLRDWPSTVQIW